MSTTSSPQVDESHAPAQRPGLWATKKGSGEIKSTRLVPSPCAKEHSNICTNLPTPLNQLGACTWPLEGNLVAVLCALALPCGNKKSRSPIR